ncbi:MAG: DUF4190 domain-containing protein [Bacteroidetes bacterium]|nr:DUF4190 domain-containing protein [Bacteroidota bacterium]
MKSFKKLFFLASLMAFALTSCTIEKRLYSKGYHFHFKNEKHNANQEEITSSVKKKPVEKIANTSVFPDNQTACINEDEVPVIAKRENDASSFHKEQPKQIPEISAKPSFEKEALVLETPNEYSYLAIASLALSFFGLGIPGIIFGVMALHEIEEKPALKGKGLAVAGIVLGIVQIIAMVGAIIFFVLLLSAMPNATI